MVDRPLDAGAIVGLLADDDRRRVLSAIELGHGSIDAIVAATDLSATRVAKAAGRLAESGLVVQRDGSLHVHGAAFRAAARQALARPPSDEHADAPEEARRVLSAFVVDGRITSIPASNSKRLVLLDWLSQDFEPGRRYTEAMVNLIIGQHHADTAAWRRYLVDHDFLARGSGEYWRSGGSTTE
ncbi:MAG: uncharacterized protein JWN99_1570 [Ilumatobacteraceae bacterium]|nr:uncharacterized protein [Ilumatobacteraceae bacterium]